MSEMFDRVQNLFKTRAIRVVATQLTHRAAATNGTVPLRNQLL